MDQLIISQNFTQPLLQWFHAYGRKELPWQNPRTPYRVWISEIMLQQTQVKTVIPYFTRFISRFPDLDTLAMAAEDDVLAYWSGLGYYSRARNLHKTARILCEYHQKIFPDNLQELIQLPGIGHSTAAAIASLAFNKPTAILDGNVQRVLSRYFLVDGTMDQASVKQKLWQLAQQCMSNEHCADYTQGIMDLGALCCTAKNPNCSNCPLKTSCLAYQQQATHLYPHPKIKKIKPTRKQKFLLLHTLDHSFYLEKNPSTGIWGGLWSIPAIDLSCCPIHHVENTYALHAENYQELITIKHSFTHFNLHIQALSISVNTIPNTLGEQPGRWFKPYEIPHLGLPKPVRDIIDYFLQFKIS